MTSTAAPALACLIAAACGSGSRTTTVAVPPTPAQANAGHPATTAPPTAPHPSATSTGPATPGAPAPCRATMLTLSYLGQQGATGHGELGFALRNVSGRACRTFGYPGILFLDRSGAALPTRPLRAIHDLAGTVPPRALTVAPGASVSFRLFVTHFGAGGSSAGCATAYGLQVIPPNDTATLRVAIGDGGAAECQTATVSPLAPGTSAYP